LVAGLLRGPQLPLPTGSGGGRGKGFQQLFDLLGPKPSQTVIAFGIEMDVFKKQPVTGDLFWALGRQQARGVAKEEMRARVRAGDLADDRVNPRVGPKGQGVGVASELEMFERGCIGQQDQALRPSELEFGEVRINLRGLLEALRGARKVALS